MTIHVIFLGPPGAGKGTQAKLLSERYRIPHISTGDLLREVSNNGSEIGEKVRSFMREGKLVPDAIVTEMVANRLKARDAREGFVLDGFPRNLAQAESLDRLLDEAGLKVNLVVYFDTPEAVSIHRLSGRLVCGRCGANFHKTNLPPKKEGVCDACGGRLIHREDDGEETVRKRLSVYRNETENLVAYYRNTKKLRVIPGALDLAKGQEALVSLFQAEHLVDD